jgi:hypothetical protein
MTDRRNKSIASGSKKLFGFRNGDLERPTIDVVKMKGKKVPSIRSSVKRT